MSENESKSENINTGVASVYGSHPEDQDELNEQRERGKEIAEEIETRTEYENFLYGGIKLAFEPITETDCQTKKEVQFKVFKESVKEGFENKKDKEARDIKEYDKKIEDNSFI